MHGVWRHTNTTQNWFHWRYLLCPSPVLISLRRWPILSLSTTLLVTMISLLRLWTCIQDYSTFHKAPNTSAISRNLTLTLCDLTVTLHDLILTSATLRNLTLTLQDAATHVMLHHLMLSIAGWGMPCAMPHYKPLAWRLRSVATSHITVYGIRGLTLKWHAPCMPSCHKIYLFYRLFLHLADVSWSQFYLAISVYPYVAYLQPTGHNSIFILHSSTIKSHVHRQPIENPPLDLRNCLLTLSDL